MGWQPHDGIDLSDIKTSVIVVSDSLFSGTTEVSKDISGSVAIDMLMDKGLENISLDYFPDDFSALRSKIESDISNEFDLILFLGGTGISPRDITIEAVTSVMDKELPGFGEEFRRKSIEEVQGMGMLSRAMAVVRKESLIIALPGSPNATKLGITIFLQFLGHTIKLLKS